MKNCILHNPRCTKSRQTLALLQENGVEPFIVEYLKTPPSQAELKEICEMLRVHPTAVIRNKEPLFSELGLSLNDNRTADEWIALMIEHPKLIERPIVIINNRAVIGRPPENVRDIM